MGGQTPTELRREIGSNLGERSVCPRSPLFALRDEQWVAPLSKYLVRAYTPYRPQHGNSLTILVRIERANMLFLLNVFFANGASIDVGWPLISGARCMSHAWRHRRKSNGVPVHGENKAKQP